jgi:pyruvate formate lyase activating enzyme
MVPELVTEVLRDKPFFDESGGGVTVSGGEPLMQADFTASFLAACRKAGLHTALETCGEAPWEKFHAVLEQTDLLLFDLKHMDSAEHRRLTGASNERILSNLLKFRSEFKTPLIIRIPVVPGFNDSEENIRRTAEFVASLNPHAVHLLPYNRLAQDKYERMGLAYQPGNLPVPPAAEMAKLKTIVEQSGIPCDIS